MTQTEQMATDLSVLDSAASDSRAYLLGFLAALRYDAIRDHKADEPADEAATETEPACRV